MTPWSNIYFALIMESRLLWNIGFYPLFLHVVSCIFVVESGELYFKQLFFMVKLVKLAITWILIFLGWHQSPQPVCRPQGDWVATANGIHKPRIFATPITGWKWSSCGAKSVPLHTFKVTHKPLQYFSVRVCLPKNPLVPLFGKNYPSFPQNKLWNPLQVFSQNFIFIYLLKYF